MIDIVSFLVRAGDGGHGRVSFRREKYVPKGGPDGGQGGDGGSVRLLVTDRLSSLERYAHLKEQAAESGEMGGKRQRSGSNGAELVLEVPRGTVVWELARRQAVLEERGESLERYQVAKAGEPLPASQRSWQWLDGEGEELSEAQVSQLRQLRLKNLPIQELKRRKLVELTEMGQEYLLCQGGRGGRGNEAFKSPALTTPLIAERGESGQERVILLELKLLADVGLVGIPSAGKSTLLSVLTKARPKIAAYPFTTLEAQHGLLQLDGQERILADIPGLIEGASQGKGLGIEFLRHTERCRALIYLLSVEESQLMDESLSVEEQAASLRAQYQSLQAELEAYEPSLLHKESRIVINKLDLYSGSLREAIAQEFAAEKPLFISAATGEGLETLRRLVISL